MNRRASILGILASLPLTLLAKRLGKNGRKPGKGFVVKAGEARWGTHYNMSVSYVPAGKMEAFFQATSHWTSPPSSEEISQVFADHDMKVVGPPLSDARK